MAGLLDTDCAPSGPSGHLPPRRRGNRPVQRFPSPSRGACRAKRGGWGGGQPHMRLLPSRGEIRRSNNLGLDDFDAETFEADIVALARREQIDRGYAEILQDL